MRSSTIVSELSLVSIISRATLCVNVAVATYSLLISAQKTHFDLQALNIMFGGPKLGYAMAKALNLPSIHSAQTHSTHPCIQACAGFPTTKEIEHNLNALHNACVFWHNEVTPPTRGCCILIDELALEKRPQYDASQDAVVGMACENASTCDLSPVTLEALYEIADGLNESPEETISCAKEATVVTLAAFDCDHYNPVPLLISGTNKRQNNHRLSGYSCFLMPGTIL